MKGFYDDIYLWNYTWRVETHFNPMVQEEEIVLNGSSPVIIKFLFYPIFFY